MSLDSIVAYQYKAALWCPEDIVKQLPTGEGQEFDGWALAPDADPMRAEDNLDEIAAAFGIDRENESSFDSGYFPKIVFADQVEDDDHCSGCGVLLV